MTDLVERTGTARDSWRNDLPVAGVAAASAALVWVAARGRWLWTCMQVRAPSRSGWCRSSSRRSSSP